MSDTFNAQQGYIRKGPIIIRLHDLLALLSQSLIHVIIVPHELQRRRSEF